VNVLSQGCITAAPNCRPFTLTGPCRPFMTIIAGRCEPPVVNSEPASGGYCPATPRPFAWTRLTVSCENLLAAIVRRKFGCLLGALRPGNLFHGLHLTAVRVKRFTAKISRVTAKISAAKKYCQSVHCDQPDGKRFATHTGLTFFPLHRGMDILNVSDFAVIHTLAGMRLRYW